MRIQEITMTLHEGIADEAIAAGIPDAAAARAEHLYLKVAHNADLCGDTDVVAGYWIETHTLGCRNAADDPPEEWHERHMAIYDELSQDPDTVLLGDPESGVFVSLTPMKKPL